MTPKTVVEETNEMSKTTKKVDLSSRVPEIEEIGGYVSSKKAANILSEATGKEVPVTTVNNLAYGLKIDAVKIAGVFLFKLDGEKSVKAYIPTILAAKDKKENKKQEDEKKVQIRKAQEAYKKHINDAIMKGETPDIEKLKQELGL